MKTIGSLKVANRVFLVGLIFAFIDQLSKVVVQHYGKIPVSLNDGIAFSIKIPMAVQLIATTIVLICIVFFSKRIVEVESEGRDAEPALPDKEPPPKAGASLKKDIMTYSFALIFGGGLGNLMDRINLGYVVDFIDIGFWPVFNVADSFVTD